MTSDSQRDEPAQRSVAGTPVHPIGLGTAPIGIEHRPTWESAVQLIAVAVDAGVTLIDTADAYCVSSSDEHGYGERLVAAGLSRIGRSASSVMVATKGGEFRPGDGSWRLRGHPEQLRQACESSLRALDREVIDLYQLHRPDPQVPLVESLGALTQMRDEGLVRQIGVCNVTAPELKTAMDVAPIASVQNPLWPGRRLQDDVLDICQAQGITYLAHSPFGGPGSAGRIAREPALTTVGDRHNVSPHSVALAWLLSLAPVVIPIPGTTNRAHVRRNVAAAELELSPRDVDLIAGSFG